jgi:Peptidase family M23
MECPLRRSARIALRPLIALLVLLAVLASRSGAAAQIEPIPTGSPVELNPMVASALATPQPVLGADGRIHLAYELLLLNVSPFSVHIDSLNTVDAGNENRVLSTLTGAALAAALPPFDPAENRALGPTQVSRMVLDLTFDADASLPARITHRFAVTVIPPSDDATTATIVTGTTDVGQQTAVVVDPPLAGSRWLVVSGCCVPSPHRNATLAINGVIRAPERFAIDFVQLDVSGRLFSEPFTGLSSFAFFGVPIYAAADGVVVEATDGLPEQTPGSVSADISVANAGGNHIVEDIGNGRFALYAHMQPGSLRVKVGDGVVRGQVIGLLGNTGNSDAPHLHFHVMDGPSPLGSNGLPFVFRSFESEGTVTSSFADLGEGRPAEVTPALAGRHQLQLPLNNQLISFPQPVASGR